jgi:hypothetical protein
MTPEIPSRPRQQPQGRRFLNRRRLEGLQQRLWPPVGSQVRDCWSSGVLGTTWR